MDKEIFNGCGNVPVKIFDRDLVLRVNPMTGWIYMCLDSNLRMLEATFMNELTMVLRHDHHFVVKDFAFVPGRVGPNLVEVLCINFELDHEGLEQTLSMSMHIPTRQETNFALVAR